MHVRGKNKAIVLMYHNIGTPPKNATLKGLYVTPRMFRLQMWYLKAAGFKVVSMDDIIAFMDGRKTGQRLVALTFDDGFQDFYDNAHPVLEEYGYPSTVFLVSDLIGRHNIWDCERLNVKKRLMDWDTIIKLKAHKVTFGSHTKTHPFLTKLPDKEMHNEIQNSRAELERRLAMPVRFFCYPYGDYDAKVMELTARAGYAGALTTKRGLVCKTDNPLEIPRSIVRLTTSPLLFLYKLHSAYEDRKGLRL